MNPSSFLEHLKASSWYDDQIVHVEQILPRQTFTGELDTPVHPILQRSLEFMALWPLYRHQAEAINALKAGHNVIVTTPAASGKSLCYNVAVLDSILTDSTGRALYVYPTKALAQDQLKGVHQLCQGFIADSASVKRSPVQAAIFDGDTPTRERPEIKRSAHILLTNPDMLHLGILPNHKTWSRLFQGLRYVILDESHLYRGVFGSHVANVVRRLRRICRIYGSSPQFVLSSATIANPEDLAAELTGLSFKVVDVDGAPYGGKQFAFWNPPIIDEAKSARRSANIDAATLFSELVSNNIRTITFVRSRRLAELVYTYARGQLEDKQPELAKKISPYRASYLPEDRRRIEKALFQGDLLGVAATNALEVGIDVGGLDATVITGYPGSVSSTWQQAGRSGRRGTESLSILVGQNNPLDQYLMNHPETFFGRTVENALISPSNPHIRQPHLLCAAYEAPLSERDIEYYGPRFSEQVGKLQEMGLLSQMDDKWHISTAVAYPADSVNIRSTSNYSYMVVDEGSGVILETVEEAAAFHQLHPGAIYLHQGDAYLVNSLDLSSRIAYVKPNDGTYYTQTRDVTDIRVCDVLSSKYLGGVEVNLGSVDVTNQVLGFRKKKPLTDEAVGEEPLDLPPRRFNTVALWFDIPEQLLEVIRRTRPAPAGLSLAGGLHAAEHAAIGVLPLFALCDRNDIGGVSTPLHPDTGKPQVFIYDGHPGGIGIAERGYEIIEHLWSTTLQAVSQCPCFDGCPSCIQSPKCGNNNQPLDKEIAIELLRLLSRGGK